MIDRLVHHAEVVAACGEASVRSTARGGAAERVSNECP
jgi:hypothetical protein